MSPGMAFAIRVGAAAAVFAAMALWEWLAPRRRLAVGRRPRWPGNLGVWLIDAAAVKLLGPVTVVGAALVAAERGWGLFPSIDLPYWAAVLFGVIALDGYTMAQVDPTLTNPDGLLTVWTGASGTKVTLARSNGVTAQTGNKTNVYPFAADLELAPLQVGLPAVHLLLASKALAALRGRGFVTPDDVRYLAGPVLKHRLLLSPDAELDGATPGDVLREVVNSVEVPR